jgi:hypothetical protein
MADNLSNILEQMQLIREVSAFNAQCEAAHKQNGEGMLALPQKFFEVIAGAVAFRSLPRSVSLIHWLQFNQSKTTYLQPFPTPTSSAYCRIVN